MTTTLDAFDLAARLLDGLDGIPSGPVLKSELARRLAEEDIASLPALAPADPERVVRSTDYHFRQAIRVAARGAVDVPIRFLRTTWNDDRWLTSYSGTGEADWVETIGRIGREAFAEHVQQLLDGAIGMGFEVGFGLGRTGSTTISMRRVAYR